MENNKTIKIIKNTINGADKMKKTFLVMMILLITIFSFGQDSRYDADKNLPFNQKAGDVNPQTGNITLGSGDVELPGRAGYNFTFGRMWSLNQSNVFNMYYDNEENKLNSNTIEKYNMTGTGWSTTIPYIMKNGDGGYETLNLFFSGSVFQIDQTAVVNDNPAKSNILGYDLLNMRIFEDTSINYGLFDTSGFAVDFAALKIKYALSDNPGDISKYELLLKSNEKYWFRSDGRLMMQEDKTGLNRIWYFYEEVNGESRLKAAVDTMGREIVFTYDVNENLSKIEWTVDVGVKNPDGTRSVQTKTRSIQYGYISAETYEEVNNLKGLVIDYETPYLLSTITDSMGYVTKYNYTAGEADFTYNADYQHSTNVYMLLTEVVDKYRTDGFKSKRVFEYEAPAEGMFTKYFYNGYMEHYKMTRQYNINMNDCIMNDISYAYYDADYGTDKKEYSTVITMGNVKSTYYYTISGIASENHVLDKLKVETADGFLELTDYVYNSERAKTLDQVFRNGKLVYIQKYTYDSRGNLKSFTDKQGLKVNQTYDDKYSIPVRTEKILHEDGTEVTYITKNNINSLGQVTEQIINLSGSEVTAAKMTYDVFGNVTSQEDADGNITYTVYDSDCHVFPVKIYQDTDIASWASGDVHANWTTDPTGTKKVRIRSWKVFNTDGTIWIEVDNEGYAVEHYYDDNSQEIEIINPDLNDETSFAEAIAIVDGSPVGNDFDNFLNNPDFNGFLTSREDNPGARIEIDYLNDYVHTYTDIDVGTGAVKETGRQGDGLGNVLEEIEYADSDEYIKEMVYDSYGRMVALTDPDADRSNSTPLEVNGVIVNKYDKTWIVKYDDMGRKIKVLYPKSSSKTDIKTIVYDDLNNTVTTTDPENRKVMEKYDWNGNIIELVHYGDRSTAAEDFQTYSFEYDELNRKTKFTDAKGIVTIYRYDERNLLLEQDYGVTGSDIMEYNDLGQLVKKTDRKGQVIAFTYDQLGRNTEALHYKSTADYDSNTLDHKVELAYDNRGNAVRIANQNLIEHYIYDFGNRVIILDRKLKDASLRQLISDRIWGGDANTQVFSFSYTYNDAGMVTDMTYPDGKVHSFTYDDVLGRLESISQDSEAFVTNLDYNKSGVVTKINYANSTAQTWEFDNRKRISHINISNSTGTITDLKYTLNGAGDVLKINDNEYGYDGFDRIVYAKSLIPETANQQDVQKLVFNSFGSFEGLEPLDERYYNVLADFNGDGRINGFDHIAASFDIAENYDVESFEYDKNGNRTKLIQNGDVYTYIYGERNRLEKIEVLKDGETVKKTFAEYEYDGNGNTAKRTVYENDGTTIKSEITFEYDTMNRLVKTTEGAEVSDYFYDNAGNRFIKVTPDGTSVYLRHGQIAVAMDMELPVDTTEKKGIINRYILSGDLLAGRITKTVNPDDTVVSEKFYYHLDHLNSTKCVTDASGSLNVMYEYRAFGEQLKKLGEGDAKYTYGGKELDGDTNLYYFNARYYDATIGRFINVDPVQDGTNWYVYCNNNPLAFVDPTGLKDVLTNSSFTNININYDQLLNMNAYLDNSYEFLSFIDSKNTLIGNSAGAGLTILGMATTNPILIAAGLGVVVVNQIMDDILSGSISENRDFRNKISDNFSNLDSDNYDFSLKITTTKKDNGLIITKYDTFHIIARNKETDEIISVSQDFEYLYTNETLEGFNYPRDETDKEFIEKFNKNQTMLEKNSEE